MAQSGTLPLRNSPFVCHDDFGPWAPSLAPALTCPPSAQQGAIKNIINICKVTAATLALAAPTAAAEAVDGER